MKIYLVCIGINCQQNNGFNYGLAYIGSVLKKNNFEVSYFTLLNSYDCEYFYEEVKMEQPALIGFSVTTSQFNYLKEITLEIKKRLRTFIVLGGPHPTLLPDSISEIPCVDAFITGEGEYPMLELAEALKNNTDYTHIKNLCYIKDEKVIKNPIRPLIEDLDDLPFPDQECLMPKNARPGQPISIRFIFSRGCPFECSYCSNKAISEIYPNKNKYYRRRSPQNAIMEMEKARKQVNFASIVFDDDCFTLDKKWFYEFITLYMSRYSYPFRCNIRVGTVNEEIVKKLKEAGARDVGIGIEHGNEKYRIEILKKTITNKQIEETFALFNKHEISHSDFIMVGMPFETRKLFLDTVKLCRKIDAKGNVSIFNPYPKTELGDLCLRNNWMPVKDKFREREEAVIDFPKFSKEDIQLAAKAFPFFIINKKIPLNTPLALVPSAYYVIMGFNNIFLYYMAKIRKLIGIKKSKK